MKALPSTLNKAERELLIETERARMLELDEDELVELHRRVRRARTKYVTLYRRGAAGNVKKSGGRGHARPKNSRKAGKAEIFEGALARVSRRLAVAAKQSAAALKAERLEAARNAPGKGSTGKGSGPAADGDRSGSGAAVDGRVIDRGQKSPGRKKREAFSRAAGARRQAKRDSR